jgi:chromosome segregation ATPase
VNEPWTTGAEPEITPTDLDALDTITLLQEEITRLEAELRLRDESVFGSGSEPAPDLEGFATSEEAIRQIEHLNAELIGREETIGLLLEHTRLLEEAEATSRAEWEQLRQWVEEVERRVEQRGGTDQELQAELESERQRAETQRQTAEADRRRWEAQRLAMEKEVEQLRATLSQVTARTHSDSDAHSAAFAALELENQQLREARREWAQTSAAAAEVEPLRKLLLETTKERDELKREIQRLQDDRERERNEHEAALGALRSQLALESIKRHEEQVESAPVPASKPNARLEADERIRAFRQHLKEIHEDEEQQRMKRGLAARLSRLWRHTGPNG